MNTKNATRIPTAEEIEAVVKQINIDFIRYIAFADTITRYIETKLEQTSVSRLQAGVLHFLVLHKGKWTPSQIAKIMFRSKHSLTKLIDALEQQGLVVRDDSAKDRRVTYIKITSAGLDFVAGKVDIAKKFTDRIVSCLSESERRNFLAYCDKLRKTMAVSLKQTTVE